MGTKEKPRLTFYPFAYALSSEELNHHCWYCLSPETKLKKCLGCGIGRFCNEECQTLGWKDHKGECSAMKRRPEIPDIEVRLLGRIVLRHKDILKGRDKKDPNFYKQRTSTRSVMEIWTHSEEMKKDTYAWNKFIGIYEQLQKFYDEKFLLPKDVVFELHCRNYINRHAISDAAYSKEIGKGLYLDLCAYDHSCRPNTVYTCNGFVATLRGLTTEMDINDKTSTFYSYIELVASLPERQKFLKDTWYFECKCERCVDNNDNTLTSVICPTCPDRSSNLCIFGKWPYKDTKTSEIVCPKCEKILSQEYCAQSIELMRYIGRIVHGNELHEMTISLRKAFLEDLLDNASKYLPLVNVFRCSIIQLLIPLVDPNDHKVLLKLHLDAEECVRYCFPKNHPSLSFHLRNIGIFLQHLGHFEKAKKYVDEAVEMMTFTMDENHIMTAETVCVLDDIAAGLEKRHKVVSALEEKMKKAKLEAEAPSNGHKDDSTSSVKAEKEPSPGDNQKENVDQSSLVNNGKPIEEPIEPQAKEKISELFSEGIDDMPSLIE